MKDLVAVADQIADGKNVSVNEVCTCLAIPRSSFYEHRSPKTTTCADETPRLTPLVMNIFWKHRRRYGTRRIVDDLNDLGITACRRTVANIMKAQGLRALQPRSFQPKTTDSRHRLGYSPNLLLEEFSLTAINQLWVADITYVPLCGQRFAYLSMIMDRFSRRLIGWYLDVTMTEELVLRSLTAAIRSRRPTTDLIHHSDRGGGHRREAVVARANASAASCVARRFAKA